MDAFDDAHVVQRHVQVLLPQGLQLAARIAGNAPGRQPLPVRPLDGIQDVRAVAAAADGDQNIPRRGQVLELLDKDPVEAFVVAPRQDVGRIVGQTEDLQPLPVVVEKVFAVQRALAEILAEVGRVRAAAAIAADEDEFSGLVGGVDVVRQAGDLRQIESFENLRTTTEIVRRGEMRRAWGRPETVNRGAVRSRRGGV